MYFLKKFCIAVISLFFSSIVFAQSGASDSTVSFKVFGVCVQCKQRIQKSLKIKGVQSASWDVSTKILT
ncbi:MAG TPA: hypothetical protein VNS32_18605, partial [Flavisolibacter sp.]|nr:hypothetical protein [Flavisolibacter sp.]